MAKVSESTATGVMVVTFMSPTSTSPWGLVWEGHLDPGDVEAPATLLDITPTLLGLLDLEVPEGLFQGFDWSPVFRGEAEAPVGRVTFHQAHRGAVRRSGNTSARRQGLLEVARVFEGKKETFRVTKDHLRLFDLRQDPAEVRSLVEKDSAATAELLEWLRQVREGLEASDALPPPSLDAETLDQLEALGYID